MRKVWMKEIDAREAQGMVGAQSRLGGKDGPSRKHI